MRKVATLVQKEFLSYFHSPIPYIILTIYLALTGIFFYFDLEVRGEASLRGMVPTLSIILMILTPAISMRLLSEESRSGTYEVLMTDPVTDWQVVLGKFFGALAFYAVLVSACLLYGIIYELYGSPDWVQLLWACAGLILYGSLMIGIGLFASSLTRYQIVAYIFTFVCLLFLFLVDDFFSLGGGVIATIGERIGIQSHYESFQKGLVDSRDLLYFITSAFLFLFLTVRVVESRRWR